MDVVRTPGSVSRRGPAAWFTGTVWLDELVKAPEPCPITVARVTFEPSARTAWHTHPLGQILHIVSGAGRVQMWGGTVLEVQAGDTVHIAPGEKHWHGAAPDSIMVHLAIHEAVDGKHVDWLEPVSDDHYAGR